jgi:hypothetical protein
MIHIAVQEALDGENVIWLEKVKMRNVFRVPSYARGDGISRGKRGCRTLAIGRRRSEGRPRDCSADHEDA